MSTATIQSAPSSTTDDSAVLDVEDLHRAACRTGALTYKDPVTGFTCFTEVAHLKRGVCCGAQCRHCPYGWENAQQSRAAKVKSGDRTSIASLLQAIKDTGLTSDDMPMKSTIVHTEVVSNTGSTHSEPLDSSRPMKTGGRHGGRTTSKNVPYTRTGDAGTTVLLTGERRSKDDAAFDAMGTVDELCSVTGVCYATLRQLQAEALPALPVSPVLPVSPTPSVTMRVDLDQLNEWLLDIMSRLFDIGSHVAKPRPQRPTVDDTDDSDTDNQDIADGIGGGFDASHISQLEDWIDLMTEDLPELLSFVLPTGHMGAAHLHVARTVCRRAERSLVSLGPYVCDPRALKYVNRLSDFYFTAARFVNYHQGVAEILYRRPVRGATQRERHVVAPQTPP